MHKYFQPYKFNNFINLVLPFFVVIAISTLLTGLYFALFNSPPDYQQGEIVRIMYIHVPSAWMSLIIYSFMAMMSCAYLIWKNPLVNILAISSAPIGAGFALITLITGSLWGKPIWGTWWVWDARLTSMLILFFFYIGYISLSNAMKEVDINSNAPSILSIVGFINIPIVKFSVDFWNSLHQPASIIRVGGPAIHSSMLKPLLLMAIGSLFYFFTILIVKVKIKLYDKKIQRFNLI
ncbi:MAG: heme ABC transporter permease [Alphaproteobacteria bacterium]